MAVPLKKDSIEEENLTTADLAESAKPEQRMGPRPVTSDRAAATESATEIESGADIESGAGIQRGTTHAESSTPLFPGNELENLRKRWADIQTAFVDEPRQAVEQADGLVASAMKRLAEVFSEERSKLEKEWDGGGDVSTEDLRVAFQRYRTFFQRLLSV